MSTAVIVGLTSGLFLILVGAFLLRSALREDEPDTLPVEEIGKPEPWELGHRSWYGNRLPDGYGPPPPITPEPVGDETRSMRFTPGVYGRPRT